jgi:hypothetical protein
LSVAQTTGSPTHSPASQASGSVQGLPSLHVFPLLLGVWVQPSAASQASAVQGLSSLQPTGLPPWHTPAKQVCPAVHSVPVLHGELSGTGVCGQVIALQSATSEVQGLPSSQFGPPVGSHTRAVFGLLSSS